jgi:molybdopterin synthase sulfur carrier subunit
MATVRYWAAARELAGTASEEMAGLTLSDVLVGVAAGHGPRMAALLGRSIVLVDGEQVSGDAAMALSEGATVEVLPPYAGGAR